MHARKSLLFNKKTPWTKKDTKGTFDITMGSYDGAEVCELVGAHILNNLTTKYDNGQIGLYRDDGLAVFKDVTGSQAERIKKDTTKVFKSLGLRIVIETNLSP